jgi:COMPASS component SPP1
MLTELSHFKAAGSSSVATPVARPSLPLPSILKPPRSTNKPGYKYKYPEAAPTPDGEDDDEWNKVYTAADSRFYNKHGKSSQASKKYRLSGETYELAVTMLAEKKEKARSDYNSQSDMTGSSSGTILPPKTAKPKKVTPIPPPQPLKREPSSSSRDATPGMPLSISEQIKQEGRARKAPSAAPSSKQGTPAPTTAGSPVPKIEKPPAPKVDKPVTKKKGIAAPIKKPTKPKQESALFPILV